MKTRLSTLAAASTLILLSGCGGSGGESSGQPVGPAGLSITAANKDAITQAVVTGGITASDVQGATDAAGTGGKQPGALAARARSLSALAQRALSAGVQPRMGVQSATAHPEALPVIQPCSVSGSVSTSFNDVDGNGALSAGDVLSVQFVNCHDSATSSYNGKVSLTLTSVPDASHITANVDFLTVTSVQGGVTSTIDGTLVVAETDTDSDATTTMTMGVSGLAIVVASAGYNDAISLQSGLHIVIDQQLAAARTTLTFDGLLSAQSTSEIGATLSTVSPIVLLDADTYPSAGVLKVKGLHGTLLLTVLSATTLQEQLDANDDGNYDSTTTVAWSALFPS